MVNFVIPVEDEPELLVVGVGNKVSLVHWPPSDPDNHTTTPVTLHTFDDDHFNVAKCDPQGRLWAGTSVAYARYTADYTNIVKESFSFYGQFCALESLCWDPVHYIM